jgi:hypothetical protein
MKQIRRLLACLIALLGSTALSAQDIIQLEGTSIIGNKELPMVLYIVPWKSAERFDMKSPQITSIMDQKLGPIDRASFKRTINYHQTIYSTAKPASPALD